MPFDRRLLVEFLRSVLAVLLHSRCRSHHALGLRLLRLRYHRYCIENDESSDHTCRCIPTFSNARVAVVLVHYICSSKLNVLVFCWERSVLLSYHATYMMCIVQVLIIRGAEHWAPQLNDNYNI